MATIIKKSTQYAKCQISKFDVSAKLLKRKEYFAIFDCFVLSTLNNYLSYNFFRSTNSHNIFKIIKIKRSKKKKVISRHNCQNISLRIQNSIIKIVLNSGTREREKN